MFFLVTAYDYLDSTAPERRLAARKSHLSYGESLVEKGFLVYATAILNSKEEMIGSLIVYEVETKKQLDEIMANEPYIKNDVWEKINIQKCRPGPLFLKG